MDEAMAPLKNAIHTLSKQGYCCSQILALLILGAQGKENPDLVRALAGLCHGIGQSGDSCGILTGGCCVIAYLVGPTTRDGTAIPEAKLVQEEFVDWFNSVASAHCGSSKCSQIIGEDNPGGPSKEFCRELLARAWTRLLGILAMNNIAYASYSDRKWSQGES